MIARDHIGSIIPSPVIIEPYGHSHGGHRHQHGVYGQRISGGQDSYDSYNYDQVYYDYDQSQDYSDQYQAYYTAYSKGEEAAYS